MRSDLLFLLKQQHRESFVDKNRNIIQPVEC